MKFKKKPIIVDAEQFWPDKKPWPIGVSAVPYHIPRKARYLYGGGVSTDFFIDTLEGKHEVTPGDWIITGVKGEYYPCKPDIFQATYDPV